MHFSQFKIWYQKHRVSRFCPLRLQSTTIIVIQYIKRVHSFTSSLTTFEEWLTGFGLVVNECGPSILSILKTTVLSLQYPKRAHRPLVTDMTTMTIWVKFDCSGCRCQSGLHVYNAEYIIFYSYNIGVILEGDKYCDGDDYMARSLLVDLGKE